MFTKRHEQELAEIKSLAYELDRRVQEVLEQLRDIREAQGLPAEGGAPKKGKRREGRKRRQGQPAAAPEEE